MSLGAFATAAQREAAVAARLAPPPRRRAGRARRTAEPRFPSARRSAAEQPVTPAPTIATSTRTVRCRRVAAGARRRFGPSSQYGLPKPERMLPRAWTGRETVSAADADLAHDSRTHRSGRRTSSTSGVASCPRHDDEPHRQDSQLVVTALPSARHVSTHVSSAPLRRTKEVRPLGESLETARKLANALVDRTKHDFVSGKPSPRPTAIDRSSSCDPRPRERRPDRGSAGKPADRRRRLRSTCPSSFQLDKSTRNKPTAGSPVARTTSSAPAAESRKQARVPCAVSPDGAAND